VIRQNHLAWQLRFEGDCVLALQLGVAGQIDCLQLAHKDQQADVLEIVVGQVEGIDLAEQLEPLEGCDGTITTVELLQLVRAGDTAILDGLGDTGFESRIRQ